jgi:YcxB-like protein
MFAMTFSYQNTRRDFVDACVAMGRKTYWFLFGLWLLLAIFSVWMNEARVLHGSASERFAVVLPIASCGAIFLLVAWWSPRYRARRMILREVSWTFSDEGVHLASNVSNADFRWEAFVKYRETPKVFLLFVQKGMAQFIPKRALTAEQANDLRTVLAAHVKAS